MIKKLTIVCENIINVESEGFGKNGIRVEVMGVDSDFIQDIEIKDLITGVDHYELLEAIGADVVDEWLSKKGETNE